MGRGSVAKLRRRVRLLLPKMEEGDGFVAAAPVVELREIFRRFWPYARPYRRWLPLLLFFAMLGSALPILRPEGWRLWLGPPLPVYPVVPSHVSTAHDRQWRSWPTRDPRCLSEVLLPRTLFDEGISIHLPVLK
jgi:hypothetical protein